VAAAQGDRNVTATKTAKAPYRLGINSSCPLHSVTLAGHVFPRTSEIVSGYGHETTRRKVQGTVVYLSEDEATKLRAAVAKACATRVVRFTPKSAKVYATNTPGFEPMESDAPLANFVYMVREANDPSEEVDYPTLASEPIAEPSKQSRGR